MTVPEVLALYQRISVSAGLYLHVPHKPQVHPNLLGACSGRLLDWKPSACYPRLWSQGLAQMRLLAAATTSLSLAVVLWRCHLRLAPPELTVGKRAYSACQDGG